MSISDPKDLTVLKYTPSCEPLQVTNPVYWDGVVTIEMGATKSKDTIQNRKYIQYEQTYGTIYKF